jgi:hypothetical protein
MFTFIYFSLYLETITYCGVLNNAMANFRKNSQKIGKNKKKIFTLACGAHSLSSPLIPFGSQ